jgi:ribonucleotide reductase class II
MNAPNTFEPVRARTYARFKEQTRTRETWEETVDRAVRGISELIPGEDKVREVRMKDEFYNLRAFPAGRWLWVGGTDWVMQPKNSLGAFNCVSTTVESINDIGMLFDLCCQGCGTGAVLEWKHLKNLNPILNKFRVKIAPSVGSNYQEGQDSPDTFVDSENRSHIIRVGDSREGWTDALVFLLYLYMTPREKPHLCSTVQIDLSRVRPKGKLIRGFGGVSNPDRLPEMFRRISAILNRAAQQQRQLTPEEVCLIIDEGAETVVAGNVRRSAGIRQFDADYKNLKLGLYSVDENGNFKIDHKRQPLRMANHTKVYHRRPSLEEIQESVQMQYETGEGAIQFAPAAIARANRDALQEYRLAFIDTYCQNRDSAESLLNGSSHRLSRYGENPCAEIIGHNFACNLSEFQLSQLDPDDHDAQSRAIEAATLAACSNLHFTFPYQKLEDSRQVDPIIGVGFTGLFDFFVRMLGDEWLQWCLEGRPHNGIGSEFRRIEEGHLATWRKEVNQIVDDYCKAHDLMRPNRVTTVKPSGTLSQLSGSSPGWHPSKAARFIRRITFGAHDPVAKACLRYGYNVVPSQKCLDDDGVLIKDLNDPRVDEWLVEIPCEAAWVQYVNDASLDTQEMPAVAQFDLAMQVQKHYTEHNTSSTIELDAEEVDELSEAIHKEIQSGEYVSFAIMQRARPEQLKHTFPLLPYEPITAQTYQQFITEVKNRREKNSFQELLEEEMLKATQEYANMDIGESGCSKEGCDV